MRIKDRKFLPEKRKRNRSPQLCGVPGKLESTEGESIAEALVAVLITALAALVLATMVISSSRLVTKSQKALDGLYAQKSDLEQLAASGEKGTKGSVKLLVLAQVPDGDQTVYVPTGQEITDAGAVKISDRGITYYSSPESGDSALEAYTP
ncbi:MAG: hypothetical protein ACOYBF_02130 [Bilifractor porci]|jgi:hypothetical protein